MIEKGDKILTIKKLNLPTVPFIVTKALKLIEDGSSDLRELEKTISSDPALAVRVLKIANSAYYGLSRNISQINEAIYIIGLRTLKDILLTSALKDVYKVFGVIEKMLWEHSVGVAFASTIIGEYFKDINKEEIAIAGLVHDIGKIVINNNFPKEYVECLRTVLSNKVPVYEVEKEIFGFDHSEVGEIFAEKWGFSSNLIFFIKEHHNYGLLSKKIDDPKTYQAYLTLLLADSICTRLGVGYKEPMVELVTMEEKVLKEMNFDEYIYSKIVNQFIDNFAEYLDNFSF